MSVHQMEERDNVHRYAQIQLDHFFAAATLGILCLHQDISAMV